LTSDPNRSRPRSSKKQRARQGGVTRATPTQRATAGPTRGGQATGGVPTIWLVVIGVVVFGIGVALAGGAIQFGGGGAGAAASDLYAYSAAPGGSADGQASGAPGGSIPGGSLAPGASAEGGGIPAGCPKSQPAAAPAGQTMIVAIETPKGAIEVTLTADLSPIAVGNFLALASCGYYDSVVFHRVVPNFVIQGGDGQFARQATFDASRAGTGGPGYEIQDEPVTAQYSRGTVAMARTSAPNSVGSQFFIVLSDDARSALAGPGANTYQIIGSVSKGMEVADAIAAAADAENPSQPIPMTKVTVAP
jgi:cyclophilin family peptidyl-prolyl cis-trans isomerase